MNSNINTESRIRRPYSPTKVPSPIHGYVQPEKVVEETADKSIELQNEIQLPTSFSLEKENPNSNIFSSVKDEVEDKPKLILKESVQVIEEKDESSKEEKIKKKQSLLMSSC